MPDLLVNRITRSLLHSARFRQRNGNYCIFIFKSAAGKHILNEHSIPVTSSSIHFVAPGLQHSFKQLRHASGYCIEFSEDFFYLNTENKDLLFRLPFFSYELKLPQFNIPKDEFDNIYIIAEDIANEFKRKRSFYEKIILSGLNNILLKYKRVSENIHTKREKADYTSLELVAKYQRLIKEHFCKQHLVNFYADKLNLTSNYLNVVVKKATGQRASDLIHKQLILESKRLLIHTKLSHKEVAEDLGFSDQSYFTKFFKLHTGHKPLDWFRLHK